MPIKRTAQLPSGRELRWLEIGYWIGARCALSSLEESRNKIEQHWIEQHKNEKLSPYIKDKIWKLTFVFEVCHLKEESEEASVYENVNRLTIGDEEYPRIALSELGGLYEELFDD